MAPPKGWLTQRIMSPNFLGIKWCKPLWMAPYSNFYPLTLTAGQQGRLFSSFIHYGNAEYRMGLLHVRSAIVGLPIAYLAIVMAGQCDWYQMLWLPHFALQREMPQWAQDAYTEQYRRYAREKPGIIHKHKWGGQVSIPGSEINITDA